MLIPALFLLLTGSSALLAAPQVRPDPEYLFDLWHPRRDMPHTAAFAVTQTPDGYLWIGTYHGLGRFSASRFQFFERGLVSALRGTFFERLHVDTRGRLWIASDEAVHVWESERLRVFGRTEGWPGGRLFSIADLEPGVVCLSSDRGGLVRSDGSTLEPLPHPLGTAWSNTPPAVQLVTDGEGRLWARTEGFLGYWQTDHWQPADSRFRHWRWLARARDGGLWLVDDQSVQHYKRGQLDRRLDLPSSLPDITDLLEDAQGHLWMATSSAGLWRSADERTWLVYNTANGFPSDRVYDLFEDREANLWAAVGNPGLVRFKPRAFIVYDRTSGLPEDGIASVTCDSSGVIWFATVGGRVGKLQGDEVSEPFSETPLADHHVTSVCADRTGRLWIGTREAGLFVLEAGRVERFAWPGQTSAPLPRIYALASVEGGGVWVGTAKGLFRVGIAERRLDSVAPELADVEVLCLAPAGDRVWAGTRAAGLFCIRPDGVRRYTPASGLPEGAVEAVHVTQGGDVWMAVAGTGLVRLKNDAFVAEGRAAGLPVETLYSIFEDDEGRFWLGSSLGILCVQRDELERGAEGDLGEVRCRVFDEADGLLSRECARGAQPVIAQDGRKRLWFATMQGLATLDPAKPIRNAMPPAVRIESIAYVPRGADYLRGVERPWSRSRWVTRETILVEDKRPVKLPPGCGDIQIRFSALSFRDPSKVRYRFRFAGQKQWNEIGSRRTASFDELKPGRYRFEVTAANADGVWNPEPSTVEFTVLPFFWQTWWFRGSAVLMCAGLCGVGLRLWQLRQKQAAHQQRALDDLRSRLALVLENTSDFVGFVDVNRRPLYVNPAGRRLIGLKPDEDITQRNVADLYPDWANRKMLEEAIPTALREGIWQGESALRHQDGREIPVSQVVLAHRRSDQSVEFISTIARDISALRQAEMRLRESEERLRLALESTETGVWEYQVATQALRWEGQAWPIFGAPELHPPHTLTAYLDRVPPDHRERVRQAWTEALERQQEHFRVEHPIVRPSGVGRWIQIRGKIYRDASGRPERMMGTVTDVTMQKREENTREGLRRLAQELTGALDLKQLGRVMARGCRALFEYDAFWLDLVEPSTGERFAVYAEDTPPDGDEPVEITSIHSAPSPEALARVFAGEPLLINRGSDESTTHLVPWGFQQRLSRSLMFAPLRHEGRCLGVLSVQSYSPGLYDQRDLEVLQMFADQCASAAMRVQAESALREERNFVAAILDTVEALVLVLDANGRVIRFNQACERLTGCSAEEVKQRRFWEFLADPKAADEVRRCFAELDQHADPIHREDDWQGSDGTVRRLGWTLTRLPTADPQAPLLVVTGVDLTERQRAEQARRELEARLRQSQKMEALGTLAGGIAHDFNNILAAVLGYAELLRHDLDGALPARRMVERILEASRRGRDLVQQILTFSRRGESKPRRIDLRQCVKSGLQLIRATLPATVSIEARLGEEALPMMADPTQVHQVLMNLCTNAWQAIDHKAGRIEVHLFRTSLDAPAARALGDLEAGHYVCLQVRDNGRGMDRQTIERIFDPFFTTKEPGQGTGLGLAVVHGIVQSHHGGIRVQSQPGRGTTIEVYFPLTSEKPSPPASQIPPVARGQGERVLVVDDEEAVVSLAAQMLQRLGYHPTACLNPAEALQLFLKDPNAFDVVVTDLTMPGLTGLDLATEMRRVRPELPILLITGYGGSVELTEPSAQGICELVHKPFTPQTLGLAVQRALQKRPAAESPALPRSSPSSSSSVSPTSSAPGSSESEKASSPAGQG